MHIWQHYSKLATETRFQMKKFSILVLLCMQFCYSYAQEMEETQVSFSSAISSHIVKYNQKIDVAYDEKDLERAKFLFDSLVDFHLKGTYLDNFNVYPLKGDPIEIKEFDKPMFLITYASWCVPGSGEIPALNDLADRFHDQIDFVMLFWDKKESLKDIASEYNSEIHIVHVNEKTNTDSYIINKLKHALGFPMMYFMNTNKKVLDVRKVVTHHSSETMAKSYDMYFESLSKGVSLLISDLETNPVLITKNEEEIDEDDTDDKKEKKKKRKKKRRKKEKSSDDEEEVEEIEENTKGDERTEEEMRIDEEYEKYRRQKDSLNKILKGN